MSSELSGDPAASNKFIASLKLLIASLYYFFLKNMLPLSFKTISLSSSSFKVLSSFGGSGLVGVLTSGYGVAFGSDGVDSVLKDGTGKSAGVAVGRFLANSSYRSSSAVFIPSSTGNFSMSSMFGSYLMPSSCSMYFRHLWIAS
jgi:hypothetical protein